MQETKKIIVKPGFDEDNTTQLMLDFGWTLLSSQEINNRDSHLETKENWKGEKELWSVTESQNYINLLFSRETNMPYYREITKLESDYYHYKNATSSVKIPSSGLILAFPFVIISFIINIYLEEPWDLITFILSVLIAIVWVIKKRKPFNEARQAQQEQINSFKTLADEARAKSRSLLRGF